jgi:hypothetical protein
VKRRWVPVYDLWRRDPGLTRTDRLMLIDAMRACSPGHLPRPGKLRWREFKSPLGLTFRALCGSGGWCHWPLFALREPCDVERLRERLQAEMAVAKATDARFFFLHGAHEKDGFRLRLPR